MTFTEAARRQQIVRATIEVLAESGYGAASLAAIAARLGISKGVISYHFAGKDELMREVVGSVLGDAAAFMGARVTTAQPATQQLRAYVTSNLEFLATHRQQIRALTEVLNSAPPATGGAPMYEAGGEQAVQVLTTLLAAGQRNGEFGDFSAAVAARSLRASIDAVSGLLRQDPGADLDNYARDLLALFERGIAR